MPPRIVRQVCREIDLADVLLVPSKFVANQLVAHGVPDRKIVRVPYGVDLDRFSRLPKAEKSDSNSRVSTSAKYPTSRGFHF